MNKMVRSLILSSLLCVVAATSSAADLSDTHPPDAQRLVFLSMLLKDDPSVSVYGSRSINMLYLRDVELTDYVAERLFQFSGLTPDKSFFDAIKWYAVTLGDTENPRYFTVLTEARQKFQSPDVVARIDTALAKLQGTSDQKYVPGSLNLQGKREELKRWMESPNKAAREQFTSATIGQGFSQMMATLGPPTDMTTITIRSRYYRGSKLVAHYEGGGSVVLALQREAKSLWTVAEPVDEVAGTVDTYQGDQFGAAQLAGSLRGGSFRDFLKFEAATLRSDPALLAVLAKRLAVIPFPADKLEADANEIAVAYVGARATTSPELMELLDAVAEKHQEPRVKKLARKFSANARRPAPAN